MTAAIQYTMNRADAAEISGHLAHCDADFIPVLSDRVRIEDYAHKIATRACRFEAWTEYTLVGLVAAYFGTEEPRVIHVTSVSVLREWAGHGIAAALMKHCFEKATESGIGRITLEVAETNAPATGLYEKFGFHAIGRNGQFVTMESIVGKNQTYE
jgi:ribosomal protein S18 acetylase RimI-like enzyme